MENKQVHLNAIDKEECPTVFKDDQIIVPFVGMEFHSSEEASEVYRVYAISVGFGTLIQHSHYKKVDDSRLPWYITFACDREGHRDQRQIIENLRPTTKLNCPAMMSIKRKKEDYKTWICSCIKTVHNHDVTPLMSSFHRSHKHIDMSDRRKIILAHKSGVRTYQAMQMMATEAGGFDKLSYSEKEVRNYIDLYKRLSRAGGDANTICRYFAEKQSENPSFFYEVGVDQEGRLMNVFWVDGRCRSSYNYFGDVVTFDTTYLTNRYDMPFAPFVGVNHHGQSVLLGCALLANETIETFVWLFKTWLKAMGRPPTSIITDQCPAIQAAVKAVFPDVRYRLCLWHIMKKQNEKFGGMSDKGKIMSLMNKCVYGTYRVEDFERQWKDMIKTYKLESNEWLQSLYSDKELWVPTYLRNAFFAGMQTTQRSESINHFFDGYLHSRTTLSEFVVQYDRAVSDRYEKEIQADFADYHSNPVLKINHCFEVQGAAFYTRRIFQKFQREILSMSNCVVTNKEIDGAFRIHTVNEIIPKEHGHVVKKEYKITYDGMVYISCACCLFDFQGILCNHILHVLYNACCFEVPECYMLPRWRKNFKRTKELHSDRGHVNVNDAVGRSNDLWHRFIQFSDEAAVSKDRYLFAIQALTEATSKIRLMDGGPNEEVEAGGSHAKVKHDGPTRDIGKFPQSTPLGKSCKATDNDMHSRFNLIDPSQARRRGLPRENRLKSHSEKLRVKCSIKKCGICKKPGHTRRTCVKKKDTAQREQYGIEVDLFDLFL